MQKEFINIASHETKTPTQAILGYSTLIHRHPEKQTEMLQAISRNATRLQKMTNEILDVTRIESQSLRLHKECFNLLEVISSAVDDYRSQLEKANTNVELVFESTSIRNDKLIYVQADKSRISQVISNLLSNAIKFAKETATTTASGYVAVSVLSESEKFGNDNVNDNKNEVVISVKDTGNGIDPEIFPKLFSKFATKSESGTGLGLFISKSIIEAHGGRIWAKNINSSGKKGAIFYFSVPLSNDINNRYKNI
jgi:two-component system sensor histidine kinase VicK